MNTLNMDTGLQQDFQTLSMQVIAQLFKQNSEQLLFRKDTYTNLSL